MHSVDALIDQDCDWGVSRGIWSRPGHCFHDDGIADHQTEDPGRDIAPFLARDLPSIEAHELHQIGRSNCAADHGFQIRFGFRGENRVVEGTNIRATSILGESLEDCVESAR